MEVKHNDAVLDMTTQWCLQGLKNTEKSKRTITLHDIARVVYDYNEGKVGFPECFLWVDSLTTQTLTVIRLDELERKAEDG